MIAPTREKLRESLRNIQIRFELELQLLKTSGIIRKLALAVIKIESSNLEIFEFWGAARVGVPSSLESQHLARVQ